MLSTSIIQNTMAPARVKQSLVVINQFTRFVLSISVEADIRITILAQGTVFFSISIFAISGN